MYVGMRSLISLSCSCSDLCIDNIGAASDDDEMGPLAYGLWNHALLPRSARQKSKEPSYQRTKHRMTCQA